MSKNDRKKWPSYRVRLKEEGPSSSVKTKAELNKILSEVQHLISKNPKKAGLILSEWVSLPRKRKTRKAG